MKIKILILAIFLVGCGSALDHETEEDLRQQACIEDVYAQLPPGTSATTLDPLDLWRNIKIYCKDIPEDS